MKKMFSNLMITTLMISPVWANGEHGSGHSGGHGEPALERAHSDKMHQHRANKSAVGSPAQAAHATKTVLVTLNDDMQMNFKENLGEIKSGTVIQFMVTNEGKIPHEFSVGNQQEQKEHAEMMRRVPGMVHSDGNTQYPHSLAR